MQYGFMAHATHACMTVNDLYLFAYDDVAEYWEEREDRRKGTGSEHDEEWDMVNFEAICEISDASSVFIRVCDYYNFVSSVDQLCRELVDVAFDSPGLWKEEVADHSNVIWHLENEENTAETSWSGS